MLAGGRGVSSILVVGGGLRLVRCRLWGVFVGFVKGVKEVVRRRISSGGGGQREEVGRRSGVNDRRGPDC